MDITKSKDSLIDEYKKTATNNLRLEFILQEIAKDLNISVAASELDQLISSIPDQKTKDRFSTPSAKLNLEITLIKRKTVEGLHRLAGL